MKAIARNILLHHLRTDYVSCTGRPRTLAVDYVLERIAYVLRTGCQWSNLPVENGSWKTIYHYFAQWSKQHIFERAFLDVLRFYLRRRGGVSKNIIVDHNTKPFYDCIFSTI
jgi:transposase